MHDLGAYEARLRAEVGGQSDSGSGTEAGGEAGRAAAGTGGGAASGEGGALECFFSPEASGTSAASWSQAAH